jgi:hypothetical protein
MPWKASSVTEERLRMGTISVGYDPVARLLCI